MSAPQLYVLVVSTAGRSNKGQSSMLGESKLTSQSHTGGLGITSPSRLVHSMHMYILQVNNSVCNRLKLFSMYTNNQQKIQSTFM